ncbi:ABC transporter ATP-binding protein [Methylocystis parvus]|uniref:ABC transporter ATP-binding protein n=1 Tax=Methylocystis parvus TaxID=134 RepID=A0A6B8M204_9HYPH|nr:ABC transporter ATP-binding protein [Methylocystis parvus]QGM96296.1 ABC transporter ATP-binding protein [Methylocystis parvus]WBJ99866.1 ABC transporter ATP-binding protein [Methylocystis parvus OBBP]
MASPLVSLHAVSKTFPSGVTALSGVDLDVRRGEALTLLGPSGCGKSTVLRLISGLAKPSGGAISWDDPMARKNIGFVFQDPTLLPWASVFDNVYLPLRLAGAGRTEAVPRIEDALARVGLSEFASALPRELSGGMKMRCAIARALVTKPSLLLMDEPFAALDEVTRFKLNDDLVTLKQDLQATIVFVTHSIFESAFLSTRIIVMSKPRGRIVDEIAIDPGLVRDADFRTSAVFSDICRRASHALRKATGEAA